MFGIHPLVPTGLRRLFARVDQDRLDRNPETYLVTPDDYEFTAEGDANLVTSATGVGDWHLPVLDLDVPHRLEPSSTEGHSHLYIDVPVKWDVYVKLLDALANAGIVERGYVEASKAKGATMVRKPGVTKPATFRNRFGKIEMEIVGTPSPLNPTGRLI